MNAIGDSGGENLAHSYPELAAVDEARRTLAWFNSKATPEAGFDDDWRTLCGGGTI